MFQKNRRPIRCHTPLPQKKVLLHGKVQDQNNVVLHNLEHYKSDPNFGYMIVKIADTENQFKYFYTPTELSEYLDNIIMQEPSPCILANNVIAIDCIQTMVLHHVSPQSIIHFGSTDITAKEAEQAIENTICILRERLIKDIYSSPKISINRQVAIQASETFINSLFKGANSELLNYSSK